MRFPFEIFAIAPHPLDTPPPVLASLTNDLRERRDLSTDAIADAVIALTSESISAEAKADFLGALSAKGETVDEISAFAGELRDLSIRPELDPSVRSAEILDVCGTGGDRLNTFNISTCVSLIAASAGVYVAKHGNRAITSQCGSSEVLEALGIRIDLAPADAALSLREHHFTFFFAPKYHPAFKHIAPARKLCAERGTRTIFNFMGPLLNPARPSAQLVGVPRPEFCQPIAQVLQKLGIRRGMVVSGRVPNAAAIDTDGTSYLDEFSSLDTTAVAEFYHDRGFHASELAAHMFPVQAGTLADLVGGDRQMNAEIIRNILGAKDRGPRRDAVQLNAAAALFVAGRAPTLTDGWDLAADLIDSGRALAKLESLAAAR
jgi:anthranilate phosphoribosyltransferase